MGRRRIRAKVAELIALDTLTIHARPVLESERVGTIARGRRLHVVCGSEVGAFIQLADGGFVLHDYCRKEERRLT